jgi:predicted nucleic acid-binding protein
VIYLLDTNIISEVTKPAPDLGCEAWLEAHKEDCFLCSVTISELRYGIERLPEGKRKAECERDYQFMVEDYRGRFYEFDGPAAFEWGRYAAELEAEHSDWWKHFDLRDTQIAAIAREYGLTIATRNGKHFPFCQTENPFQSEHAAS